MPSNWLYIDTNFPAFTGEESMEEKVTSIQDYMYLLVEQLRYTLHNLDLGNMNKTAKERWESAITEPIYAKIEDDEERILQLAIDAGALALRISDSEGNITQLQATAEGLQTRVSDNEGNISTLQQTAQGLATAIADQSGSHLDAPADGLLSLDAHLEHGRAGDDAPADRERLFAAGEQRRRGLDDLAHEQRRRRVQREHLVLGPCGLHRPGEVEPLHDHQRGQHHDRHDPREPCGCVQLLHASPPAAGATATWGAATAATA